MFQRISVGFRGLRGVPGSQNRFRESKMVSGGYLEVSEVFQGVTGGLIGVSGGLKGFS